VGGVRPLVITLGARLQSQDRGPAPRHRTAGDAAEEDPSPARVEEHVAVGPAHVGLAHQKPVQARSQRPIHRGGQHRDARPPSQLALPAPDEVVRQGLDLAPAAHEAAGVLRVLAAGDRFHDPDRPTSARAAGQLRRAQDGGGGGTST
jgi:hypothetical protein